MELSLNVVVHKDQPEEVERHYTASQTEGKQLRFCLSAHCCNMSFDRVAASTMHAVLTSVRFGNNLSFENNQPCRVMPASTLPVPYTTMDEVSEIKKASLCRM